MQSLVTTLNAWSAPWSQFMLAVLWQSTLLAAAVGAIAWPARRASPAVRYWLWQIVAIKLLLAPIWTLGLPLAWLPARESAKTVADDAHAKAPLDQPIVLAQPDSLPAPVVESLLPLASDPAEEVAMIPETARKNRPRSNSLSAPILQPSAAQPLGLSAWLMICWGGVVACQVLWLVWQRARLARFLAGCEVGGETIEQIVRDVAEPLRLRRVPTVRLAPVDCSPFVCGLLRPTLVLPRTLESLVTAGELRPVIVHELAHLKRGDLWFGWAPQLARVVYFFHPVAHWAAFRIRLEAELACDGWAMNATGQGPAAYADLLVQVVSRLSEPALLRSASAGLDGQSNLENLQKNRK